MKTFPSPEALRRFPLGMADLALLLGTFFLLALVARLGAGALVSFAPPQVVPQIDLDPRNLPYYAGRSTLRMFIALFFSTLFTLVYGYVAANNRWAERVMIPLLDILQSVPVLGFLSITVTGFIALFPGSLLGLEAASIFAIFTSQVWNMTFSFYQSLRTVPMELREAATLYQLSRWQRFTTLEVPSAVIGLLWNAMMSFDDLPRLAERLQLEVDDLLPILDAAVLLGFATVSQGDVQLTEIGQDFATTTILRSKDLFRQQALAHVAVLSSIVQTLREKRSGSIRADFFLDVWDEHFPHPEAERQFATTVDWGRYAELFEYDASEDRLYLPDFSPAVESTA